MKKSDLFFYFGIRWQAIRIDNAKSASALFATSLGAAVTADGGMSPSVGKSSDMVSVLSDPRTLSWMIARGVIGRLLKLPDKLRNGVPLAPLGAKDAREDTYDEEAGFVFLRPSIIRKASLALFMVLLSSCTELDVVVVVV